jgi:drug/metabolite transporter (DMT)-like permease
MKRAYFKYILALLLFGSNGVVASHIGLTSYEIVLLRSFFGGILLIAIFFFSKRKLTALRHKKDMFYIAASGVAMAAAWLFLFEAFAQIGVSMGILINYSGPVIVMALSPLLFKERMTGTKLIALLAALSGVFLISGQAVIEGINVWGLLYAGLSAIAYAAMVIFNKMSKQVTGLENSTLQLFFAFVTAAVFVGFKQGFHIEIAAGDWLPVLWIGLLNTGASCYLYFSSIGKLPVQTVAVCSYLEPLSAVIFSAIFLREMMSPLQILGAVFIIGGALFGECSFKGNRTRQHGS